MRTKLVTAPVELPLTLEQTRMHLKMSVTAEDALILSWLNASVEHAETFTRRRFITQTWDALFDGFPCGEIEFQNAPLQSITSVTYIDDAGVTQILNAAKYQVDAKSDPGRILPAYGETWPSTMPMTVNTVTIRFVCGYGFAGAVPFSIKAAIALMVQYQEGRQAHAPLLEAAERLLQPYRVIRF